MALSLSVIIPTLNAAHLLTSCLEHVYQHLSNPEVLIVDGGSTDQTLTLAKQFPVRILTTEPGRGHQCRLGAEVASPGHLLFFLHADTLIPANAMQHITTAFQNPKTQIATFRLAFDEPNWLLSFYGYWTRWDTVFTRFGDQGILIRDDFYDQLGGFPDWPLFEDVHLLRMARKKTNILSLPAYVITSAQRFRHNGVIRQQLFNAALIVQYLRGRPPEELAKSYQNFKQQKSYA